MEIRKILGKSVAAVAMSTALAGFGADVAEARPRDGSCAALQNAASHAKANADHYFRQGDNGNARYWQSVYQKTIQNIQRRNC
ncbi:MULTISPECIES: hypothetical protein [unclassified Mycobacterium]|uniref:hypothetical protein n=1 Tax=unclassified Mycobacterium TaxID=2642494 RepID=UPI00073FDA76|nr:MULTISPECIES: hypothetical protein [unclassified Mycobacterium]KUH89148.1 hypothetical protein AU185_24065 [Mycobacterium sp. GA-0227b]